jgi:uncharacterized membrane protein YczE
MQNAVLRWGKRLVVYFLGLFIMAIGVVFSVKSALGVSPVTCLANVVCQISGVNLGLCTTAVYCLYILVELLILRRDFKPEMLLQIVASFIFGSMVSIATALFAWLPAPTVYPMRLVFLLCSIPMVAVGVMLYLAPNILPTPGEGMSLAISKKTGLSVASSKMIFDCSCVVVSTITSLVAFHGLVGVREGTVISAFCVGFVMKRIMRVCQPALLRFVERETKLERAVEAAVGNYRLDSAGKPKIIIAIGREYGSGGYYIGQKLAEKLGITFYDQQLVAMEAQESGLSEDFILRHEQNMSHEVLYDLMTASYAMSNEGLPPLEKLFAAQTSIFRRIAASDESCVIVGRCADYILYNDPNCFRIFIHATPTARIQRLTARFHISESAAKAQMEATDQARARHYKHFTGREYGSQQYYHLAVDSGQVGIDGAVELIMESIRLWCGVRGTDPLSILNHE